METNVLFALSLTVMAGLATGIGSIIALFAKTTNTKFLAGSLGFSAGVMIYVSMIEIFQKSRTYIASATNDTVGYYIAVVSFFVGILLIGLIDYFVPSTEGDIGNLTENETRSIALKRMGFMTALAIGIHNFPEGLATFTSALKDPHLGLAIAVSMSIPLNCLIGKPSFIVLILTTSNNEIFPLFYKHQSMFRSYLRYGLFRNTFRPIQLLTPTL